MRIEHLTCDEQAHDLAAAFENRVDPRVAEEALHRLRGLASRTEAVRGFIATSATDLHRVIHDLPCTFGAPELGHRRFEPDIRILVAVHE